MNKQLTIIGIIGILIAISISGCLENNKEGNGNITPLSGQVTVKTNKTEFEQNENVNFTLFNGKNGSIYLSFGCGEFCINFIEEKTVSGWELFWVNDPNIIYDCMGTNTEIKEGESIHLIWKAYCLWVYNESNNSYECCLVEPGVYRLKFDYFTDVTWKNVTTVHSNEFTIKEEKTKDSRFIGKWTGEISNLSGEWNMTFFTNSSVLISYDIGFEGNDIPTHWGEYEITDEQICLPIYPTSEPVCLYYEFSDNDTFLETSGEVHFLLEKVL